MKKSLRPFPERALCKISSEGLFNLCNLNLKAMDNIMPGFDKEIARMAERLLIKGRPIDYQTGVIATKVTPGVPGVTPVTIELTDFKTKKVVDTLEVDAVMVATGR